MSSPNGKPQTLGDICRQLRAQAEEHPGDEVRVQTILEAFTGRVFGPLLLIPALVVLVPPLGAIPAVPTTMGVLVVLVAGQSLWGRSHPWLPRVLLRRSLPTERLHRALDRIEWWSRWIDRLIKPRLRWLVTGGMKRGIALICVLLACALPPLELIPFAAAVPGAGLFCLGLAITAEDGLLGLCGIVAALGAAGILLWAAW